MRYELKGNWRRGWAFDLHTLDSTYIGDDLHGHPQFDTTYSEMGHLVRRLKYQNDQSVLPQIIALLEPIRGIETFDAIVPVPSSKTRALQPVDAIAAALGGRRGVKVLKSYLVKTESIELKNITDPGEREKQLQGQIVITGTDDISGQKVLLLDDLYRSGATLNACSTVLKEQAKVGDLCVLTMTKTRSNR